jgi:hypothetical protein
MRKEASLRTILLAITLLTVPLASADEVLKLTRADLAKEPFLEVTEEYGTLSQCIYMRSRGAEPANHVTLNHVPSLGKAYITSSDLFGMRWEVGLTMVNEKTFIRVWGADSGKRQRARDLAYACAIVSYD